MALVGEVGGGGGLEGGEGGPGAAEEEAAARPRGRRGNAFSSVVVAVRRPRSPLRRRDAKDAPPRLGPGDLLALLAPRAAADGDLHLSSSGRRFFGQRRRQRRRATAAAVPVKLADAASALRAPARAFARPGRLRAHFSALKAPRKLVWRPTAGVVTLEVEVAGKKATLSAKPLEASLLLEFSSSSSVGEGESNGEEGGTTKAEWRASELAAALKVRRGPIDGRPRRGQAGRRRVALRHRRRCRRRRFCPRGAGGGRSFVAVVVVERPPLPPRLCSPFQNERRRIFCGRRGLLRQ